MSKTINLCMIVKNESKVIQRCLASVLPLIDKWIIVDTGSTDGTQEIIKKFFEMTGVEGELVERPWKDFATNRSEALEIARERSGCDYSLMIDADEILVFNAGFDPVAFKAGLNADLYNIFSFFGGTKYHRPQMTCNSKRWYYRGVLHEYADCHDPVVSKEFAKGFMNTPIQDGFRAQNPKKYLDDAIVLENALKGDVDPREFNRYHFYLAQCYRDAHEWDKAVEWYKKRAALGGWNEEVFFSLYQVGRIMEVQDKHLVDDIIKVYIDAFHQCPFRSESLWAAASLCRRHGRFDQALTFARQGIRIPYPHGALFVYDPIYEWMMIDEFSIAAFWSGKYRDARQAGVKLLQDGKVPQDQRQRIEANLKAATEALINEGG
jgi:glycosyltransferase involved in cell wall biosynthesis